MALNPVSLSYKLAAKPFAPEHPHQVGLLPPAVQMRAQQIIDCADAALVMPKENYLICCKVCSKDRETPVILSSLREKIVKLKEEKMCQTTYKCEKCCMEVIFCRFLGSHSKHV